MPAVQSFAWGTDDSPRPAWMQLPSKVLGWALGMAPALAGLLAAPKLAAGAAGAHVSRPAVPPQTAT